MSCVIYAAPFFSVNAVRFLDAVASLPDVQLGLISQEPQKKLPSEVRAKLAAHYRVEDALDSEQLVHAAQSLSAQLGPIHRVIGVLEQIQVPLAEARERLGVKGLSVEAAKNFRDKARMKDVLRAHDLPCARHHLVTSMFAAWQFAEEVGYPLVVKPPAGAGAASTFRADDAESFDAALRANPPTTEQEILIEEFITGEEHSFDTFTLNGQPLFHTLTHYSPAPLEVLRNPWIQWAVVLPREVADPKYDDIRAAAFRSLEALGVETGLSHMEWFRRRDGSLAISEVGARPPGAQITTLISRACDFDSVNAWARLMVFDEFETPQQKCAVGIGYLRGQGQGSVKAIHGLDEVQREIGHLITDVKLPEIGAEPSSSYEGDGYVILRHEDTSVVEQAVSRLITLTRVELG